MSRDYFNLNELTQYLGRNRREVEKQVSRGLIPGRRVAGEWRFNQTEITSWLEKEMPNFSDSDLATLEQSQENAGDQDLLSNLLHPNLVLVPLDAGTKPSVLKKLVDTAMLSWQVFDSSAVLQAVRDREDVMSTSFDGGVAIPHPQNRMADALGESLLVFGRTLSGIPFGGSQRSLTDLFFLLLCRDDQTHLRALARLGRLFQQEGFLDSLRSLDESQAAYEFLIEADRSVGKS